MQDRDRQGTEGVERQVGGKQGRRPRIKRDHQTAVVGMESP